MSLCPSLVRLHAQTCQRHTCQAFKFHLPRLGWLLRDIEQISCARRLLQGDGCRRSITSTPAASTQTAETAVQSPAPSATRPNVVEVLRSRGLVQDITSPELEKAAATQVLTVYCGFDPTASSLHLGNLLGIMVLSWFQRCGHQPLALLGGATGRVGDPSGKSAERPVLDDDTIQRNIEGIEATLRTLLASSQAGAGGAAEPLVVNNLEWFGGMKLLTFLRDVGKFARVGTMIAKDSVRTRLESDSGISFTEFTYQLLQGYDFVHLRRQYGVSVQVGGSDQWGNITAGTDLMRKISGAAEEEEVPSCFGLTFPLLTSADGKKFGKSESGAIWLSPDWLTPYQFYQYLYKTTDADVIKFLKMLTFVPLEEIDAIQTSMQSPDYVPNTAQRRLAEEVTRFVHGEGGLQQALKTTQALAPGAATELDAAALESIAGDAPSACLPRGQLLGCPVVDVCVAVGLQPSKGAVKRLIKGGGVYLNNTKLSDEAYVVQQEDLIGGRLLLLATGKKNKMLVKVE